MTKSREERLIDGIKHGDSGAQREFYDLYAARLLAICMRYLSARGFAEDALHDSVIKIFQSINKFTYRGEGSLRAWSERVTVNCCLEHLRSKELQQTTPIEDGTMAQMADDVSTEQVTQISQEMLLAMIAELPAGYRSVFNLYCIEEYSHREIADMLGIAEKSSSSQLLRAKRLLATKIREHLRNSD